MEESNLAEQLRFMFNYKFDPKAPETRKQFVMGLGLITGAIALLSFKRFKMPGISMNLTSPKVSNNNTVKMLSQTGQLVEVDISGLCVNKKKVTDKQLQNWIKR